MPLWFNPRVANGTAIIERHTLSLQRPSPVCVVAQSYSDRSEQGKLLASVLIYDLFSLTLSEKHIVLISWAYRRRVPTRQVPVNSQSTAYTKKSDWRGLGQIKMRQPTSAFSMYTRRNKLTQNIPKISWDYCRYGAIWLLTTPPIAYYVWLVDGVRW